MSFTHWLSNSLGLSPRPASRRKTPAARPTFRPRLEAMEDRWVPSTLTVTNNLDSGTGSLRADIAAARSGDTIVFAPSLVGQTITLTSGELLVNKNLTIAGPGAGQLTISGGNLSRVFEVANGKRGTTQFALSGLTISNGVGVAAAGSSKSMDGSGGGILVDAGAALTVNNSTLSGNSTHAGGGGIYNGGTLTVTGSTLSGNVTTFVGGGGIFNFTGTVMVIGSTLSSNSCTYTNGGGIFNRVGGTLTVTDSTLSANTTAGSGGGIFSQGALTVRGSTLSGNSSHQNGGGIFFGGTGTAMVSDSTLTGNTANYGGAIHVQGGTLTVSNSVLSGNSAVAAGGGIFINIYGTVTVKNSSHVTGNTAPVGFGADVDNLGVLYLDSSSTIGILDGNPAVRI